MRFIAIDFETANSKRNSPCEIGIVKVENFEIIEKKTFLIRPKDNYFDEYNSILHGISEETVEKEPEFNIVYQQIKTDFETFPIVAHNASFDISVLRNTLDLYGIGYPETNYACTYQLSKIVFNELLSFRLDFISDYLGIKLEHHRALSDAVACAEIAIRIFKNIGINDFKEIEEKLNLRVGKLYNGGYTSSGLKRKGNKSSSYKISDLEFSSENFDIDSPFYDKTVVFTGTLQSFSRKEAQVKVLETGGKCGNGITSKTDFLIVGEQDFQKYGEGFKSSKVVKAEKLLKAGKEIELLTESQFQEMINNK